MSPSSRERHPAARAEDAVNAVVAAALRRRGWVPRVIGYAGYGGPGWVRVLGRVLAARPGDPDEVAAAALRDLAGPLSAEQLRTAARTALRGWRAFVNAPLAGAPVWVTVGGQVHRLTSGRGGYLDAVLPSDLPPGPQRVRLDVEPPGTGSAQHPDRPDRDGASPVEAPVQVVGPEQRTGVVSDIDDTVITTSLPRPLIAAYNTFVLTEQARRPVAGMADLLRDAAAGGAPVIYLSTGAWNVAATLSRFMARHHYPPGPMLLTDWGPTNTGWFRSGTEHKRAALRRLAHELPQVRWLLVGDDGQHDPEVYGEFAAAQPDRVRAVAIRQLTAAEQVLSHALPVPGPGMGRDGARGPGGTGALVVRAPDGDGLAHQLRRAGVLGPEAPDALRQDSPGEPVLELGEDQSDARAASGTSSGAGRGGAEDGAGRGSG